MKRRILSMLIAVTMVLSMIPLAAADEPFEPISDTLSRMPGDVDGDGVITVADVIALYNYVNERDIENLELTEDDVAFMLLTEESIDSGEPSLADAVELLTWLGVEDADEEMFCGKEDCDGACVKEIEGLDLDAEITLDDVCPDCLWFTCEGDCVCEYCNGDGYYEFVFGCANGIRCDFCGVVIIFESDECGDCRYCTEGAVDGNCGSTLGNCTGDCEDCAFKDCGGCGECEICLAPVYQNYSDNGITDAVLREMVESGEISPNVTHLWLERNRLTDITPLESLEKLVFLNVNSNHITSIEPIVGITTLADLRALRNDISDILPLAELENLITLYIGFNSPICTTQIATLKEALPELEIFHNAGNCEGCVPCDICSAKCNLLCDHSCTVTTPCGKPTCPFCNPADEIVRIDLSWRNADGAQIAAWVKDGTIPSDVTHLNLARNKIDDVTSLKKLNNLVSLSLRDNLLCMNRISDLQKSLEDVFITYNAIDCGKAKCTACKTCKASCDFFCCEPCGRTCDQLSCKFCNPDIPEIYIDFSNKNLTDADLKAMVDDGRIPKGTTHLWLTNNQLKDITPLNKLTVLTGLWIGGNEIENVRPLENLTRLTVLSLHDNNISNLSRLTKLERLETLNLESNAIVDLKPLAELDGLIELYLGFNKIVDIKPLAELTALTELGLNNNSITDIAPLANMTGLNALQLNDNRITNLSPLFDCLELIELRLRNNIICLEQINELRDAIDDYGVGRHGSVISHNALDCGGCVECEVCGATCGKLCGSGCYVEPKCTGNPDTCKIPGCTECAIPECECGNCEICGFDPVKGGMLGFGNLMGNGEPGMADALQILRLLVKLSNVIEGTQALPKPVAEAGGTKDDIRIASRVSAPGEDGLPTMSDALQVLRYVVKLSTTGGWADKYKKATEGK
ncbi:MAG: leucine-rich repeat domain-containing protein [Oscillospiraceae bacterium]|nr:leucine-rich repeat domain-containing protein [Oscillospiraceae bacterium]